MTLRVQTQSQGASPRVNQTVQKVSEFALTLDHWFRGQVVSESANQGLTLKQASLLPTETRSRAQQRLSSSQLARAAVGFLTASQKTELAFLGLFLIHTQSKGSLNQGVLVGQATQGPSEEDGQRVTVSLLKGGRLTCMHVSFKWGIPRIVGIAGGLTST